MHPTPQPVHRRFFASFGALACASAVALGAYAAHASLETLAKTRLDTAVLYLVIHGLALCLFAPRQRTRLDLAPLAGWAVGILAFCGSLVAAALWNTSTAFAPIGGIALIAAWLLQAIASLRR